MRKLFVSYFSTFILLFSSALVPAEEDRVVLRDGGVTITQSELEAVLATAPPRILGAAANDLGDRYDLLNGMVVSRKLALEAEQLTPEDSGYWKLQSELLGVKEKFAFDRQMEQLQIGNFEALAQEYYRSRKNYYALQPEKRTSSHILLASPPGEDRVPVRLRAAELLEELNAGADFGEMVQQYSDDPGSKARGGSIDRAIILGDPSITPPYSGALFDVDMVGGYSQPTDTEFGVHIIRLDGIEPASYLPFEEVRNKILTDIVTEVRTLASKELRSRYYLSEDAFIDGAAMESFFAPYKQN